MTAKTLKPRPRQTAFRFSEEAHANLDMLVRALSPGPHMPVTKAAVVEKAIREMAERHRRRRTT